MGRVLGIDHGERRTGLALSDVSRTFASPYKTVAGEDELLDEILRLVREEEVDAIVVGLPLNMDGTVGDRARQVLGFKGRLEAALREHADSRVAVETWDERLSTLEAEGALRAAGLPRRKRKARVDKVAAQVLLQCYLDRPAAEEKGERG